MAIGRGGQNVRLASKLTGFEIDFKEAEEVSDLDEALLRASEKTEEVAVDAGAKARFDSLFADTAEGEGEAESEGEA